MRNLKRTLSLVLAAAMLVGMMVVSASAVSYADFSDKDEVTNVEAVSLLNDLGIIEGTPDGSYKPTATIDRATMAKLITKIVMGDVDASAFAGTQTDLTDIEDNWAEGYIKYCYSTGIIAGDGAGHFFPSKPVTVVEAAKMLLVALGYDAETQGYVNNTNWSVNIMKDAATTRDAISGDVRTLTKGLSVKATDPLTRDNAAQMIFNTLFVQTVSPVYQYDMGKQYIISYNAGASLANTMYGNPIRVTALVTGIDSKGKATLSAGTSANAALATAAGVVTLYNNKLAATPDMIGNTVAVYVLPTGTPATPKALSTALAPAGSSALYTLNGRFGTTATGSATLTALVSGDKKVAELDADLTTGTVAVYYNGALTADAARTNAIATIGLRGVEVKLNDTDADGKVDTIAITEKTVATLSAAPTVSTTSGKTYVTIPSIGVANKLAEDVIGYEGLAKDDVVLYLTVGSKTYIEKAESITGTVTGNHSSKGALINGEYKLDSEINGNAYNLGDITDTKEYNFFLDNAGNIVKAVAVSGETTSNYAVVRDIVWVKPVTDGSIGATAKSYAQAKLVFTDGTAKVVTIASIDGYKPVGITEGTTTIASLATGTTHAITNTAASGVTGTTATAVDSINSGKAASGNFYALYDGATVASATLKGKFLAITDASAAAGTTAIETEIPENTFYAYTENTDGTYALSTTMKTGDARATLADNAITNNKVSFDNSNVGNSETVFIYTTVDASGNDVYTVYTGIANAPTTSAAPSNQGANAVVKGVTSGIAKYVFAVVGSTQTASTDVVYISNATYTSVNGTTPYYIYDAVVNGSVTTIKADAADLNVGFYKIDKVVNEVATLNSSHGLAAKTGVKSVSGNTLVVGDGTAYIYTAGAPAYVITVTDGVATSVATTIDALTLDATDEVKIVTKSVGNNTSAEAVYVVKADEGLSALVLAAGATSETKATVTQGNFFSNSAVSISGLGKMVKISTITAQSNTTIKSVTINGADAANGGNWDKECALTSTAGTNSVVVTIQDNFSGALTVYTYSFNVAS